MAVWQAKFEVVPAGTPTDHDGEPWTGHPLPEGAVDRLEEVLARARSWSEDVLIFGDTESHDVHVCRNGECVVSVAIRVDLRRPDCAQVLERMIRWAEAHGGRVVSLRTDREIRTHDDIFAAFEASRASRFLKRPE